MSPQPRLLSVLVVLVVATACALAITAFVSWVLIRIGVEGFAHNVTLMIMMLLAFATAALVLARSLLLRRE